MRFRADRSIERDLRLYARSGGGDARYLSFRRIVGASVFDGSGRYVGRIDDLAIDARSGQVAAATIVSDGFLGLGGSETTVEWRRLAANRESGAYVLSPGPAETG